MPRRGLLGGTTAEVFVLKKCAGDTTLLALRLHLDVDAGDTGNPHRHALVKPAFEAGGARRGTARTAHRSILGTRGHADLLDRTDTLAIAHTFDNASGSDTIAPLTAVLRSGS